MEMRSGARAAPVWDGRCFLRVYVVFYVQAMGIQEENQIGQGAAQNSWAGSCAFKSFGRLSLQLAFFWSIGLSTDEAKFMGLWHVNTPPGP